MNQLNSRAGCEASLQRIMASVSRPYSLEGEYIQVTASVGYTLHPDDDSDADALIRHADQAMYQAKQAGRNCIQAFDAAYDRNQRARHIQNLRIQEGLQRGEFTLYVQPQIDMHLQQVIGVEALARWEHPEHGVLTPKDFLPLIEGTELEVPFGQWAVRCALETIGKFQNAGLKMSVAVNISPNHLQHPSFTTWMQELLSTYPKTSAQLLDIEITESAALYDLEHVTNVLHALRALELRVSLDDFGTGYSSLTYLRSLPLDCLKIDRSFVRDMLTDQADFAIVHGVVRLAHSFGYKVIAEGVENDAQCAALKSMGCNLVQGYCFAQ
ncbi:MAG: putative bifunctional diguanylate cyclase/phosphodiesterase, partial [Comamonas sp.]